MACVMVSYKRKARLAPHAEMTPGRPVLRCAITTPPQRAYTWVEVRLFLPLILRQP